MKRLRLLNVLFFALLGAPAGVPAQPPGYAGLIDYTKSVRERPVEVSERGFTRLGSWTFVPGAELGLTYDDNIYAAPADPRGDTVTVIRPAARLISDWARHAMRLEAGASLGFHDRYATEDYADYYVVNRNVLEIMRNVELNADLLYQHAHIRRTSPDNLAAAVEPPTYDLLSGTLGFAHRRGVLSLGMEVQTDRLTYQDSTRSGGGTIDNSVQDRAVLNGGPRLTYRPFAEGMLYLSARARATDYQARVLIIRRPIERPRPRDRL